MVSWFDVFRNPAFTHQLRLVALPHSLQGFVHLSWCTMSSIHSRYIPPKKHQKLEPKTWNPVVQILCVWAVYPGSYLPEVWVFVPFHHRSSILRTIKSPKPEISRWVMRIIWLFRVKKGIDQTTQLCGDCDKPLEGSLLNNPDLIERIRPVVFWWLRWSCSKVFNSSVSTGGIRKVSKVPPMFG